MTDTKQSGVIVPSKYQFKCYLCEQICPKKEKGADIGNAEITALREEICTNCVHKNYCWATDKELKQFTYNIVEDKRVGVFYDI